MNQDTCISEHNCQLVELGKIGRPHGVSGEVRLFLHNPDSDLIFQLDTVSLRSAASDTLTDFAIHNVKHGPRFHILSLKNVRNRDRAQQLNGMTVVVPRNLLPGLDDDEFYVADLIGMDVVCDGQVIGQIVDSRPQGGIEVISVENATREIQIPVVDDYVIRKDFSNRTFEVKNIDDLPVHEFSRKGS